MAENRKANPALALAQAAVAFALLIGLPLFFTPISTMEITGAAVAGLVLLGLLVEGVLRYLRTRKPVAFLDSLMPDKHIDVESTVIRPKRKE